MVIKKGFQQFAGWYSEESNKTTFSGRYLNLIKKALWRPLVAVYQFLEHHEILVTKGPELLKITLDACHEADLTPFLAWGSLLGYYRERGIIYYDSDIDLGLLFEDALLIEKLEKFEQAILRAGCKMHYGGNNFDSKLKAIGTLSFCTIFIPNLNIWINFCFFHRFNGQLVFFEGQQGMFPYRKYLDMEKLSKLDLLGYVWSYPPEIFSEFIPVTFLGSQVLIPKHANRYLTLTYGNWKKRVIHKCYANIQAVIWNADSCRLEFINALKSKTS